MIDTVIEGYHRAAPSLIDAYDAIDPVRLYGPLLDLFPRDPVRFVDLGAGTGRDAAWLAGMGHRVTAVEPATGLRDAGARRHAGLAIEWRDDRLPDLPALRAQGLRHGGVLLSGVWQHLTEPERVVALRSIAAITRPGAVVILSIRHGPGSPDRPVIDADPDLTIAAAGAAGLSLRRRTSTDSIGEANRRAGVTWTWLVLVRDQLVTRK